MITKDLIEVNTINAGAIAFTYIDVNQILSILVLSTALIYNICKLKNRKWED